MTPLPSIQSDPEALARRLAALPGLAPLRGAAAGLSAYLVGGVVRDLLLGRERADLDVAVEGDVGELAGRLGGQVRRHARFATATVRVDRLEIDLASTRTETYAGPGALPDVRPASLDEDLRRRDFTMNAMAIPLAGEARLIDAHGGLDDLRAGLLRVLHPGSLRDDPTRAIRAARYAARYSFGLEPETDRLIRGADLSTVSADRAEAELRKLAAEPEAARGFELLADWGLVPTGPEALALSGRAGKLLERPEWEGVAERADVVLAAARGQGLETARELASISPERPSHAVDLARGRSGTELSLARAMGAEWLDRYVAEWRHVRLEIDGNELLAAGVAEGPAVGRGLAVALARTLDGEVSGRAEQLEVALEAARKGEEDERA